LPEEVDGMRRLSFTDVLSVAAVCLLVSIVVLPVLGQIQITTTAAPCPINMKREMSAFFMYASDWDGKAVLTFFPGSDVVNSAPGCMMPGRTPSDPWKTCESVGGSQIPGWPYLLEPYRHGYAGLRCDAGGDDLGVWGKQGSYFNWWFNWSRYAQHGYNWVYLCPTPYPASPNGVQNSRRLGQFQAPGDTVVFVDSKVYTGSPPAWVRGYLITDPPTGAHATDLGNVYWLGGWLSVSPDPRHRGMANVAWMDGRVTPVTLDYLSHDEHWDYLAN
jgi:prepilin-type processing-associated H-X9-DG protein